MLEIPLTQDKIAVIDDCDAWALNHKWCFNNGGYASRNCCKNGKQRTLLLHREIAGKCRFKDGNPLNCTRANLESTKPYQNEDGTWSIPLPHGKVTIIDECDKHLAEYKWRFSKGYAKRSCYKNGNRTLLLHRQILTPPEGMHVDHVNGDKLDNRRCNLRLCSDTENQCNRGRPANNTSLFKGVHFDEQKRKWRAQIKFNGKKIHLGYFRRRRHAAAVYDLAAKYLHGDFALTNEQASHLTPGLPADYDIDKLIRKLSG